MQIILKKKKNEKKKDSLRAIQTFSKEKKELSTFFVKFISNKNFEEKDYYANRNFWADLKKVLNNPKISVEDKNIYIKKTKELIIVDPITKVPVWNIKFLEPIFKILKKDEQKLEKFFEFIKINKNFLKLHLLINKTLKITEKKIFLFLIKNVWLLIHVRLSLDFKAPESKLIGEISSYLFTFIFTKELFIDKLFNMDNLSKEFHNIFENMNKDILQDEEYKWIFCIVEDIFQWFFFRNFIKKDMQETKIKKVLINMIYFSSEYERFIIEMNTVFKTLPNLLPPIKDLYNENFNEKKNHKLSKGVSKINVSKNFVNTIYCLESFPFFIDSNLVNFLPKINKFCKEFTKKYFEETSLTSIFKEKELMLKVLEKIKTKKNEIKKTYEIEFFNYLVFIIKNPNYLKDFEDNFFKIFWPDLEAKMDIKKYNLYKTLFVLWALRTIILDKHYKVDLNFQIENLKNNIKISAEIELDSFLLQNYPNIYCLNDKFSLFLECLNGVESKKISPINLWIKKIWAIKNPNFWKLFYSINNIHMEKKKLEIYKEKNSLILSNFSNHLNLWYKNQFLLSYGENPFYIEYGIGVNSRLICEGWFPHPQQGRIFNLIGIKPYLVEKENFFLFELMCLNILNKGNFNIYSNHQEIKNYFYEIFPNFENYSNLLKTEKLQNNFFEEKCLEKAFLLSKELGFYDEAVDFVRLIKFLKDYFMALNNQLVKSLFRLDQVASALQIWSILSNCKYYQKITNLLVSEQPIDPFLKILNDFILPLFNEEILNTKDKNYKNFLLEKILPIISKRKIIKYYIFPFFYNLSVIGVKDKLIVDCNFTTSEFEKKDFFSFLMKASHLLYKAISNSSPKTSILKNLLNQTINLITKKKNESAKDKNEYSIKFDFQDIITEFEYRKKALKSIRSNYNKELGYSKKRYIPTISEEIDIETQTRASLSLFIQSFDARLLFLINKIGREKYKTNFIHIHDCHLCGANDLKFLNKSIQDAFFELFFLDTLTNKQLIEVFFFKPSLENGLSDKAKAEINLFWEKEWESIEKDKTFSKIIFKSLFSFNLE